MAVSLRSALALYCFCGDIPLWAQLRTSGRDGADGSLAALKKIVPAIRKRFGKHVKIIVRGDSGFCRDEFMAWIEAEPNVHYVLGLARNARLEAMLIPAFWQTAQKLDADLVLCAQAAGAEEAPEADGTGRTFAELRYQTLKSWSSQRRVIGKAELTNGKKNPRFIVTDIELGAGWSAEHAALADGQALYEKFCCARGDMENRIKEQQPDMFADRTSTAYLSSNQLRRLARPPTPTIPFLLLAGSLHLPACS